VVRQLAGLPLGPPARGEARLLVGRTLDVVDAGGGVKGVLELMDGGHALTAALEGQLAHAGRGLLLVLRIDAGLLGCHEQACLGRIAEDGVATALALGGQETCVRAEGTGGDQKRQVGVPLDVDGLPIQANLALGRIANARYIVFVAGGPEVIDGHLVLREGARLVGADDARRTERLDRGQLLHEGVALAHALDGHGKRERHRGKEPLGNEGHDHAEREDERCREAAVDDEDVEREEGYAHAQGEDRHLLGDAVELLLERTLGLLHVLREVGDLAELGVHADAGDDGATVALGDRGAGEDEVRRLCCGEVLLEHGVGGLAHGVRLARERGLVDLQVGGADDACVGGDLVSLGEKHDVPGDEVLGEDLLLRAVTNDVDVGGEHLLQGLGRLARTKLLPEAEAAVDDVHEPDRHSQLGHAGTKRDDARDPQENGHEVREVGEEDDDGRLLLGRLDEVLAFLGLSFLRPLRGETSRS